MQTIYDKCLSVQSTFLGAPPGKVEKSLYQTFPDKRGFLWPEDRDFDSAHLDATLVLSVVQTYPGQTQIMPQVFIFCPSVAEDYVWAGLETFMKRTFECIRQEANIRAAHFMGHVFKHLSIGSRVFSFEQAPLYWTAFGFREHTPMPEWLQNGLLPV